MKHPERLMWAGTGGICLLMCAILTPLAVAASPESGRGKYFAKKVYVPAPLPRFTETRSKLPSPVYDEDPVCVDMYWSAWELAFRNFHEPAQGSGYVSQFIDAAFNQNIFLWDTCFMTMFCNYGHPYVPGIGSLDNFYCKQFDDGEICREIDRTTGEGFREWVNREGQGLHSRWSKFKVAYIGREIPQPPPQADAGCPQPSDLRLGRNGEFSYHCRSSASGPRV